MLSKDLHFVKAGSCRFTAHPDRAITAHNYAYLYGRTAAECQRVCTLEVVG